MTGIHLTVFIDSVVTVCLICIYNPLCQEVHDIACFQRILVQSKAKKNATAGPHHSDVMEEKEET